jgi:hypothetical protein
MQNVLISADNPDDDDIHPKITRKGSTLVVVYERKAGVFESTIPVCYSEDDTWVTALIYNSIDFPEGSGVLISPDIKYCEESDEFFLTMVDPLAEMYNQEFSWIKGDFSTAPWTGVSGLGSIDYSAVALTIVSGEGRSWLVGLEIDDGHMERCPGLAYVWYDAENNIVNWPRDVNSAWAAGFYYDAQSILKTAPAYHPEMATGSERMYMVMETLTEEGPKISYKATVTDLNPDSETFLFTSGGGPQGMDKYADIEVWPWQQYIASGTDPDVSASGTNVCIVYTQDGDVKCSYSFDSGDTFEVSTVATGAGYPCVYVSGNTVYCGYVKDGNLYRVISEDGGATWGTPERVNEVDGTVAEEPGTADINDLGIVWTDTRNGPKDIYTMGAPAAPVIEIKKISGGFGVSAVIENTGTGDATDVQWSITLEDGLILLGKETSGVIPTLPAGASETIKTGLVFGIGKPTITVTANGVTKQVKGTLILFFVII